MSRLTKTRGCRCRNLLANKNVFFFTKENCRPLPRILRGVTPTSCTLSTLESKDRAFSTILCHEGETLFYARGLSPDAPTTTTEGKEESQVKKIPSLMSFSTQKPERNDSSLMKCLTRQRYDQDHIW